MVHVDRDDVRRLDASALDDGRQQRNRIATPGQCDRDALTRRDVLRERLVDGANERAGDATAAARVSRPR